MSIFSIYFTIAELREDHTKRCIKIGKTKETDVEKRIYQVNYNDQYYSHDLWFYDKFDTEYYPFDIENIYHSLFPSKMIDYKKYNKSVELFEVDVYDSRELEHDYIFNHLIDKEKNNILNRCNKRIDKEYFDNLIDLIKNKKERTIIIRTNRDFEYQDFLRIYLIKQLAKAYAYL